MRDKNKQTRTGGAVWQTRWIIWHRQRNWPIPIGFWFLRRDLLRQQYEDSRSWFYTKDEIIYKLSQGAHEESERVQTSGTSNPVERTVLNCDKVLASMNREVQTQRTEQFLEPYYEVCEQIELFEIGLRSLRGQTRLVAEQLFVDGKKQSEITGADGNNLTRRNVVREKKKMRCRELRL